MPNPAKTENEYLAEQWIVVENSVKALLLSQVTNSQPVIKLTRAIGNLLSRVPHKVFDRAATVLEKIYIELWEGLILHANPLTALLGYFSQKQSQHRVLFDLLNHHLAILRPTFPTFQAHTNQRLCAIVANSQAAKRVAQ